MSNLRLVSFGKLAGRVNTDLGIQEIYLLWRVFKDLQTLIHEAIEVLLLSFIKISSEVIHEREL